MKVRCIKSHRVFRKGLDSELSLSFFKGDVISVIGEVGLNYLFEVAGETEYIYIDKADFEPYDENKEILAEMIAEYKKKKEESLTPTTREIQEFMKFMDNSEVYKNIARAERIKKYEEDALVSQCKQNILEMCDKRWKNVAKINLDILVESIKRQTQ